MPGLSWLLAGQAVVAVASPSNPTPDAIEGGLSIGKGLRFNNPFRLPGSLGASGSSVSWTASYAEASVGAWWSGGLTDAHGFRISTVAAIEGIAQWVVSPSYTLLEDLGTGWELIGRVGLPFVVWPDASVGVEGAVGLRHCWLRGFCWEVQSVGNVFFGAALDQTQVTTYPLLSAQSGLVYKWGGL